MLKKSISFGVLALVFSLSLSFGSVLAKSSDESQSDQYIPEQDGVYDVAGHPELKVRVFVYKVKPEPNPIPTPSLVCNLTDPNSSSTVGATGWRLPANWRYNLNPSSVPSSVGSANLATFASAAFNAWMGGVSNKISVSRGSDTSVVRQSLDGQNIIAWGRTSGSALAVTYTWYNPSTKVVIENDTIMNSKFVWSWTAYNAQNLCAMANSYDAQDILTHELGHWFGLNDHYTSVYVNNTMYGYGSKSEVKKDTLTTGDIAGLGLIY